MALPVGQISMSQVNTELGIPSTTTISLNQTNVRSLAAVPTGAISMANLQGKSASVSLTMSTNQTNLDLYTWATANGYPGSGALSVTIAPGVYVYSTSTANSGLTIPSAFGAGNLTLINNGYIVGQGGAGGFPAATSGGPALSISTPIILTNNSFVAGGGGGGSGSAPPFVVGGGGGAGGGAGGGPVAGAGGRAGSAGANAPGAPGGAGGGTQFPGPGGAGGTGPTVPARGGGAGGGGGILLVARPAPIGGNVRLGGGGGGGYGAAGGNAGGGSVPLISAANAGGAGGANNSAGSNAPVQPGAIITNSQGAGGRAINLNGNSITYPVTGTIWGSIA